MATIGLLFRLRKELLEFTEATIEVGSAAIGFLGAAIGLLLGLRKELL